MTAHETEHASAAPPPMAKSVQAYIDERPVWSDGTSVDQTPMTAMQWRILILAAAGKFFEGFVVFMTGVALPLIAEEFNIGAAQHGLVSAASLFGILIGALFLGGLADRFGRKPMFIVEMLIFVVFLCLLVGAPLLGVYSFALLIFCLFGVGLALGCDYPTAHLMISESIPSSDRGRLVLGAFGFQALGVLVGTVVGYLILANMPQLGAWRWMYATAIIPALLVAAGRFFITESGHWLLSRGPHERAPSGDGAAAARATRPIRRSADPILAPALRRTRRATVATGRCSRATTGARRSSPRCPGSCRISAPMASASSRRPSWPRHSATKRVTRRATSPI